MHIRSRRPTVEEVADAPPIYLTDHCQSCRWLTHCQSIAHSEKSITLLNGISRQSWESLISMGITTAEHILDHTPEQLIKLKGIGKTTVKQIYASAQALARGEAIHLAPVPDELTRPVIMLDIETSLNYEEAYQPWSFGWSDLNNTLHNMIVARFFDGDHLMLPNGQPVNIISHYQDGWRILAEYAEAHDALIYHWSGFDAGVMHNTASPEIVNLLAPRMRDFLQVFKTCVMLPVRGRSIKTVAAYLNYNYPPESNYAQAWNDYQAWRLENDHDALARAVAYQLADVEAMIVARDWLLRSP